MVRLIRFAEVGLSFATAALDAAREALRLLDDRGAADAEPEQSELARLATTVEKLAVQQAQTAERVFQKLLIPRELGTVLLLWQEPTGAPRCVSRTIKLRIGEPSLSTDVALDFNESIPAGAWLVADSCHMLAVHVGPQSEDLGPVPRGKLVVLRDGVPLDRRLSLVLVPER